MVFTCVRGLCSKIYNKTSKEIQTFPFSLLVHNSISHLFYNPRELERLFFNSAYNHKHTYLLHHQSPFLLDWHLWEVLNS